ALRTTAPCQPRSGPGATEQKEKEVRQVLDCASPLALFLTQAKAPEGWRSPRRWRVGHTPLLSNVSCRGAGAGVRPHPALRTAFRVAARSTSVHHPACRA